LYKGGLSLEGFQSTLLLNLIWPALGWPLLAGGHCSEVAVYTGLTVFHLKFSCASTTFYEDMSFHDISFLWETYLELLLHFSEN